MTPAIHGSWQLRKEAQGVSLISLAGTQAPQVKSSHALLFTP